MSRIRSVHPGLWTDEAFMGLTVAAPHACLLLIGLWNEADDSGVFEWKPLTLKAKILPAAMVDVVELLAILLAEGFIVSFDDSARTYGAIHNFRRFQRPDSPKAWHPLPDNLRAFVYLDKPEGHGPPNGGGRGHTIPRPFAERSANHDTHTEPISRPVGQRSPRGSRKTPQMEGNRRGMGEGGGTPLNPPVGGTLLPTKAEIVDLIENNPNEFLRRKIRG